MNQITRILIVALTLCLAQPLLHAETLVSPRFQVEVTPRGEGLHEAISVRTAGTWAPALAMDSLRVETATGLMECPLETVKAVANGLIVSGRCKGLGLFEQRLSRTAEDDILDVTTRVTLDAGAPVRSVEDRYAFLQPKHVTTDEHTGPLDFVWSQNIKSEADDLIPLNAFKSPALMMQQGAVFAAILPVLNQRHAEQRALDLDVTSERDPWMSYGAIPSTPHGHSYFRRAAQENVKPKISSVDLQESGGNVEYRYSLVLSAQPPRLGYRRVVRLLWQRLGHPALLSSAEEQQNVFRPELRSFASWREDAWHAYADREFMEWPCGERTCGTLRSNRNYKGDWGKPEPDAWFNAWFQTLRTAYGWYRYGQNTGDAAIMRKAESVLNLALSSPRKDGAFSTIYLVNEKRWIPSDGWAGYADSYHTFSMSWTAYWMLRWAEDLTPARRPEVLAFVRAYGDFLLRGQHADGVIPSWFEASGLKPREEFRDFNAETAPSALFLAELGSVTGDGRYTTAAERGMAFVEREVVPRQRWFDFETFLSCARKDYSFFDRWTAQYPQNNLAEIQGPEAMLVLYRTTHKPEYLERGQELLDYLLLTQQVWSNPLFTPVLLGGFTTQNTDAEWSDARQGYAATLLYDYYDATGKVEYLERSVAAARSTFAVAPWENWAHTGYMDDPGALTGFHWGTGSAMTSVEMLAPQLGDALIDLRAQAGVGFDETSVTDVMREGSTVTFGIASPDVKRTFLVRFRGASKGTQYSVRWNGRPAVKISGDELLKDGLTIGPLQP